jgi:hypothetical protein
MQSLLLLTSLHYVTERRGSVVKTPASYLGGPGFDIRPQRLATLIKVFRVFFPSPFRRMPG